MLNEARKSGTPHPEGHATKVYVCTGCGIGECLDVDAIAAVAEPETGAAAAVRGPMCVPEAVEALRAEAAGAGRVVIAACSPRVNYDVFSPTSLGAPVVERVNLRELVAWSKPPHDTEAQYLAQDYVRMGLAKAKLSTPPPPREVDVETTILVVGGGISGLTAALEAADAGVDVVLVEQRAELGGWMARFRSSFPSIPPYRDLEAAGVDALILRVREHPRIRVLVSAELQTISGQPGGLEVTVDEAGATQRLRAGALVLATGWQPPADAGDLAHLGLGGIPDVVTALAFEDMAREGRLVRPSDGRPAKRIAFVTRPRRRDFSYGAHVADMATLKQVLYVRELDADADALVFYTDIVTPGHYESFYRRVQQEPRVFFTKGDVTGVTSQDGRLLVHLEHSLVGDRVAVPADLVVLATEMVPTTADAPVLNLVYRQGPGLPTAKFGFSSSNFICFPYETRRTGLYAAGSVREPMEAALCVEDATGAALKAIQSLELIAKGGSAHPRVGDLSLPVTRLNGCTKCGRCSEECPFSAIEVNAEGFPVLAPDRCRRCGICMGACPVRVISFENYSVEQLAAMVKAIEFPPGMDDRPRILALACENDAYPAFDLAGINRLEFDASIRVIPLRCLGSLNVAVIADAFSAGVDGILLVGCTSGENYQCHFIQGSELAGRRMENVRETLGRLMMEAERVKPVELEITQYDQIPALVGAFADEIRAMGPNPYKGF